jgi:hypothetical protein
VQNHTLATFRKSSSWRRVAPLAAFVMVFSVAWAVFAHAQTEGAASQQPPTTTPEALFQNSTLSATTNTINVNFLPVVTTTNGIIYDDVVIQFDVAADGTLTVSAGYPKVTPSPITISGHFEAGNYVGPSVDSNYLITVSGPGVSNGGTTIWSLAASKGANNCTTPSVATWYVGPIMKSPYWGRIKLAQVPLTGYFYGVGGAFGEGCGVAWYPNSLLGFVQTGKQIEITSFTDAGKDQAQPAGEIAYCKNSACGTK